MVTFCSLFSGSSGNALYFASNNTKVLIDCGVSGKRIAASLENIGVNAEEIDAILVTHEHGDHIQAVGVMSRRYNIPIYANTGTWAGMEKSIGKIKLENIRYFDTYKDFCINDIGILPFSIPHDAIDPVGYSFYTENRKVSIATDMGHINSKLISNMEGSQLILLESNHDEEMLKCGSYPYYLKQRILGEKGHLSNEMAAEFASYMVDKGTNTFVLGHLSKENNFPELAYRTVYNTLTDKNIVVGEDILLDVAARESASKVYKLN